MNPEPTSFLYPFIEAEERDASSVLADLAASARAKLHESRALSASSRQRHAQILRDAAAAMAERFQQGGRLFTFGNGGSATDAAGAVALFRDPPDDGDGDRRSRALPAMSLVDDPVVLTALANDVGFDLVFSRQIIAHVRSGDMALGFSTSGDSVNVLRAFEEAKRRGVLTVGLAGYQGGAMASSPAVDHCLVVASESVHRIQEVQDALTVQLWSAVQGFLAEGVTP